MKTNREFMRERILKETTNLFLRKGFRGTTIKDITNALNLTQGIFYWYFKSKDDLLETILEEWEQTFLDGLIASNQAVTGNFFDKFRQYHKYSTEYAANHPEMCVVWATLSAEIPGSGLKAEKKFRDVLQKQIEFLVNMIESGKAEKVVKEDLDTHDLANVIIGMHNGILLQWYTKQGDLNGSRFSRAFRTVMLSGLAINNP